MASQVEAIKRLKFSTVELVVDGFLFQRPEVTHYVLTHFHGDHTIGLRKGFSSGVIYCTPETGALVSHHIRVDGSRIVSVPLGVTREVQGVRMTFLDAGHCPGSAIVVFEDMACDRIVVHTGDVRASADVREGLLTWLGGRHIAELYLDTTYCSPRWAFPDQAVACDWLRQITARELRREPDTLFIVGAYSIGKEKAAKAVAEAANSAIFIDERRWETIKLAGCGSLTLPSGDPLWSIDKADCRVWMLPLGNLAHEALLHHLDSTKGRFRSVVTFRPTGWAFTKAMEREGIEKVRVWSDNNDCTHIYAVPYSEHSSFTELRAFVKALQPERVVPTVNAESRMARERVMGPLIGVLNLTGDKERMDFYLSGRAGNRDTCEDDLEGLVDVLAVSARNSNLSTSPANSKHPSILSFSAVVEAARPSPFVGRAFSRLRSALSSSAPDLLDIADSDDEVAVVIDDVSLPSSSMLVSELQCANNASLTCEDDGLQSVSLAQQRRLMRYYEGKRSLAERSANAKPQETFASKQKKQLRREARKGKGKGKGISELAKPATVASLLGAKQKPTADETAKARKGNGKGQRANMKRNSSDAPRPKKPRKQREAALPPEERRPTRFVEKPSARVKERIDRAFAHRLYLLAQGDVEEGQEGVWVDVLGSTGNVYRVTLSGEGSDCKCPDFAKSTGVCKHILFVMLRVLRLDRTDQRVWQTSLTLSELRPLLTRFREGTRLGSVSASDAVMRGYQEAYSQGESECPSQRPLPAECPICFDEIASPQGQADVCAVATCRCCAHHFHVDCQRRWAESSRGDNKCPLCRNPWQRPVASSPHSKDTSTVVNLAAYSEERTPALEELYPETHQWMAGRGA